MSVAVDTLIEKPATTAHPIHPLLRDRWSPRAFAPDAIPAEQVLSLFEAARWSPSAVNEQPWSFVAIPREDSAAFAKAVECLAEGNRTWAQHAPLLVLTVARLVRQRDGAPNGSALYDVGQAVAHLTVQAGHVSLWVHQMGGFSADAAREAFGIPADHAPVTFLAIGRLGSPSSLPEPLLTRELAERQRKPLAEVVYGPRWGDESPLLRTQQRHEEESMSGEGAVWQIDTSHSAVRFSVKHMAIATVRGSFERFSGTVTADEQRPEGAQVAVSIDAASLTTGDARRDAHLRSEEFLDAERHPSITFTGTRLEQRSASRGRLHGELTIRGVTRPVSLDVEYAGTAKSPWGTTSAGFSARTTISRKEWGIVWNVALETGGWLVSDEITIEIEVELLRPAAEPTV
ncbi:MAG: hypothetical protein RLZZ387_5436 [Chloroflexota bacterium]|jgi:polyisoprenoid-binding protein YceI/nitroreductase